MKVIAVLGSPHKGGASETVCERVIQGARDAGHEVIVYRINDMNVRGCQGCGFCKDNNHDCILEDDLKPYWKNLHEAGALILSAPNYCSQVAGPMITYMNRHYCLIGRNENGGFVRVHPGIKLIGVFSQGAPRYEKADAAYDWFLGDFQNRDMVLEEKIVVTRGDDLSEGSEILQKAYDAGRNL